MRSRIILGTMLCFFPTVKDIFVEMMLYYEVILTREEEEHVSHHNNNEINMVVSKT